MRGFIRPRLAAGMERTARTGAPAGAGARRCRPDASPAGRRAGCACPPRLPAQARAESMESLTDWYRSHVSAASTNQEMAEILEHLTDWYRSHVSAASTNQEKAEALESLIETLDILADPDFVMQIEKSKEDIRVGRVVPWVKGRAQNAQPDAAPRPHPKNTEGFPAAVRADQSRSRASGGGPPPGPNTLHTAAARNAP